MAQGKAQSFAKSLGTRQRRSTSSAVRRTVATWTKFFDSFATAFDIFLTTLSFSWLLFVVKCNVGFPTNDNSTSHSPCILIAWMQREAIRKYVDICRKATSSPGSLGLAILDRQTQTLETSPVPRRSLPAHSIWREIS